MKNAIITGANGFVGFALLKELLANDHRVFAIIRPSSITKFNEKLRKLDQSVYDIKNIEIIPGDLEDHFEIRRTLLGFKEKYDTFFHLAWNGSAGLARRDLELQLSNVQIAGNMVDLARDLECGSFVGAGSIMEDEALKMSYQRGGKTSLNYLYSSAKLEAHLACQIKAQAAGVDFRWAKITNAFGEGDNTERFICTTLKKMFKGEPCSFSKADQLYDFIYITDAARAFRLIGEKGRDMEIYRLGSGKATHLKSFIEIMQETTGTSSDITYSEDTTGICYLDPESFSIDTLVKDTGFKPLLTFREGILKTVATLI